MENEKSTEDKEKIIVHAEYKPKRLSRSVAKTLPLLLMGAMASHEYFNGPEMKLLPKRKSTGRPKKCILPGCDKTCYNGYCSKECYLEHKKQWNKKYKNKPKLKKKLSKKQRKKNM